MSIRYKILLILLILALSTHFIITSVYYFYSQKIIKNEAVINLESLANIQRQRLNTFIDGNIEKLKLINSRTQLRRSLKNYNLTKESQSLQFADKIIKDAMSHTKSIENIFIMGIKGDVLLCVNDIYKNETFKEHPIFLKAQKQAAVSYLLHNNKEHPIVIIFSAPLVLDGEFLGVIAMEVNMNYLNEYLRDYTGLGTSGEVIMGLKYNKDDILLFTPLRFKHHPLVIKQSSKTAFPMRTALEKNETTIENALDYRGKAVIAVTRYLDTLDFGIVVKMDREEVFATTYELKIMILQLIIVLILIVVLASILLSYIITKPVIDITEAAILISHGDFEKRVKKLTQDELGQLAKALNEMADKLIQSNHILEDKVQERTKELQDANKKLKKLSQTDALTGVANRAKFDRYMKEIWRRCMRYEKPLSLLMIDIDYFKAVNDTYGHQKGDEYLKKVAAIIKESADRVDDLPARYGGEEFVLILEDTKSGGAESVADKLRQNIYNLQLDNINSKVAPFLTISIGISTAIPNKDIQMEDFIKQADNALYKAKENGRNQVVLIDNI